jgi:cysteine-rich repeat protein
MSIRLRSWLLATLVIAMGSRAAAASEIACGETVVRLLVAGPDEIGFDAAPGEVVAVTVVPLLPLLGFDPTWRISDVQGHVVLLANGDHRCTGRCETSPLPAGGSFSVRVADSGFGIGMYVLTLEAVSATANGLSNGPPTPTCARTVNGAPDGTRVVVPDEPLAGVVDRPGETDTFTLVASAGAVVRVALTRTGGDPAFAPVWNAFDASGRLLAEASPGETEPLSSGGVVTVLVADDALCATGTYRLVVSLGESTTTSTTTPGVTTTTGAGETTTTSTLGTESTSTTAPASTTTLASVTTTTLEGTPTTTTTIDGETTTTSIDAETTTTTTLEGDSTTSTSAPATTSSTSTLPGATTTTTLAPQLDLAAVVLAPPLGPSRMLGSVIAVANGRVLVGAPHEDLARGVDRIRDAGAVLVVDVGTPGSPTFGRVVRVTRPDLPMPGDAFGAALEPVGGGVVVGAPGARLAFFFPDVQQQAATTFVPPGASDDGFGVAVAVAGDAVVVGAPGPETASGAAYVFDRATGAPHTVLTAPGAPIGARLGAALAASGTRVLVGAPGGPQVPGRAFLFDAADGRLIQTFTCQPPAAGDECGAAVAFAGDDPVIGAPGADGGAGRVDRFDVSTGTPIRSFVSPTPGPNARFGASLAIADGLLVVGAPGASHDDVEAGAVYAFDLETGTFVRALHKAMPQPGDAFGTTVATTGPRIFAGTPGDDAGTVDGGTTYVFDGDTLIASLRERLSADAFGNAAAIGGGALYVGAPEGAVGEGYVSRIDGGASTPSANLRSPDAGGTRFGASVAVLGPTVIVGAPEWPTPTNDGRIGTVYLYDDTQPRTTIRNPANPEFAAGDEFGFAVGTVDGDVLASAPFAGPNDTGLVYRLSAQTGSLVATYGKAVPTAGDFFGAALSGDAGQVLVGAPFDAAGGSPTGAAYLFDAESSALVHAIPNPAAADELFGASVALGSWIVVGAPLANEAVGSVGAVWIFDRATGALVRRLQNPRGRRNDNFGAAVALLGEQLVVGAPRADDTVADAGLVYLFDATGQLLQTFRDPPQGAFDQFGFAVATGPRTLLVGAPGPSRVYLFDPIVPAAGIARSAAVVRAVAAPLAVAVASECGNGLVEGDEACDDGNAIDTDDCRNDCTRGPCCALDPVADPVALCDDDNRCTTDAIDPMLGCVYAPSGAAGCCESDADCPGGTCRVCAGCFIYRWDCCDVGSRCVEGPEPACVGKTCVEAAFCQCEGKLDCGETGGVPDDVQGVFGAACAPLQLLSSETPDGSVTKEELKSARQMTRSARVALRKTIRMARARTRAGEMSAQCRKRIIHDVKSLRQAIPRGKRLRRCLATG